MFCGGLDIERIQAGADPVAFAAALVDLLRIFPRLGKPVIAAVNGDALASGYALVCAADIGGVMSRQRAHRHLRGQRRDLADGGAGRAPAAAAPAPRAGEPAHPASPSTPAAPTRSGSSTRSWPPASSGWWSSAGRSAACAPARRSPRGGAASTAFASCPTTTRCRRAWRSSAGCSQRPNTRAKPRTGMNIASRGATMGVDWEQRVDFAATALRAARARARPRSRPPTSGRCCSSTRTTSATSRAPTSASGRATRTRATCCCRAEATRSCGTSARPRATTSSTRRGCPSRDLRAGVTPMRGAMPVETGIPDALAGSRHELRERGLEGEPVGIDMTDMVTLRRAAARGRPRHRRQGDAHARKIKTDDEIALLEHAAAIVDAVYEEIYRMLRPGVRESEIVAHAMRLLFELGSEQVEAINAVSGQRCNPHPHVFSDRLLRPGDQAFFDIIHSFMGYRTCYYRWFSVGGASQSQLDAYKQCREWLDQAIALVRPGRRRTRSPRVADRRGARLPGRGGLLRAAVRPRPRCRPLRVADDLPPALARAPGRDRGGDGLRARDLLPGQRRRVGRPHRGGGRRDPDGTGSSRGSLPRSCW